MTCVLLNPAIKQSEEAVSHAEQSTCNVPKHKSSRSSDVSNCYLGHSAKRSNEPSQKEIARLNTQRFTLLETYFVLLPPFPVEFGSVIHEKQTQSLLRIFRASEKTAVAARPRGSLNTVSLSQPVQL